MHQASMLGEEKSAAWSRPSPGATCMAPCMHLVRRMQHVPTCNSADKPNESPSRIVHVRKPRHLHYIDAQGATTSLPQLRRNF